MRQSRFNSSQAGKVALTSMTFAGIWPAICGLLLLLTTMSSASAQQYLFRGYGQVDGLNNLSITCLVQDRENYLWVCTVNGLYRFDGRKFQRFGDQDGLKDTEVHDALVDRSGRLWVGTSHDLYRYDGQRFAPVRPDGRPLSVSFGSRLAEETGDRLLVISGEELKELVRSGPGSDWGARLVFDTDRLRATPPLAHLTSLYLNPDGSVWLGCGTMICRLQSGVVTAFGKSEGVPADRWLSWVLDAEQRLWVRGLNHVLVLENGARKFSQRSSKGFEIRSGIQNVPLLRDAYGAVITRTDDGLVRWKSDRWQRITLTNGLPATEITAMLTTRDGSMWLGSSGHGLWRWLGYETFESWSVGDARDPTPVWSVIRAADGTLTMGAGSGCLHLDSTSNTLRPCLVHGLLPGEIQVAAEDADGNLWLGATAGQLYRIRAGRRNAERVADIPLMRRLFLDSQGRLWICTNLGLRVVERGGRSPSPDAVPRDAGDVTDIAEDDRGRLWIATQGGLFTRNSEGWRRLDLPGTANAGFSSIVAAGSGWYWVAGASHGILRLHVADGKVDFARWQADPTIASVAVYSMQIDRRGWLWLGTDEGIAIYDGHLWRKFDQSDGLIWNDTDQNSLFADADGTMWIGTGGGLSHVSRPEALLEHAPSPLRLEQLRAGTKPIDRASSDRIPWHRGMALEFQLQEVDFQAPEKTSLRIRLLGLSDEWFPTRDFNIHFPALPPGSYTFEAVAEHPDHQRPSSMVRQNITILPPWWQTPTFLVFSGIVLAGVLAFSWRWTLLKVEQRRQMLERESRQREALIERATRDALTGLWNRQSILDVLKREMEHAASSDRPLAIALIDIDHFKRVNDTMGHLTGDAVLRAVAAHVGQRIRAGDSLGRYGGEELLLVLPGAAPGTPNLPIEHLRRAIPRIPFAYAGSRFRMTASFGVAWLEPNDTLEQLIGRADKALYAAKRLGRDRVEYADAAV